MKEDRKQRVVSILRSADTWVPASTLARMLGVSTRTIRTYMTQIGQEYQVESSQSGYRLVGLVPHDHGERTQLNATTGGPDEGQARVMALLSMLLSTHGGSPSVYDAAEELCISDSTLASSVLPPARNLADDFGLRLVTHDFTMSLEGSERDKRRLLRYLVTQHSYGYFTSASTLAQMFPWFDVEDIMAELVRICQASDLFLNNYALNNLLVHVLIIAARLEDEQVQEGPDDLINVDQLLKQLRLHDQILHCADEITHMLHERCDITVPDTDFRQIVLLIALASDQLDYSNLSPTTLSQLVDPSFYEAIRDIALHTSERYGLVSFDTDFLMQLTLHSYNACQRAIYGVSTANPIGAQIKLSHPLVYDMAVYFCHKLEKRFDLRLSEEEIAFFAFHFGAYLANHMDANERISCVFVSERYHDFAGRAAAAISDAFGDELSLGPVVGYDDYLRNPTPADLVITTVQLDGSRCPHSVLVSPVIGRRDLKLIRNEIDLIQQERERAHARSFLRHLLRPELFLRNVERPSVSSYLDVLGDLCRDNGYVDQEFVDDVKLREHVSSTAFVEGLAIPHAINQFAKRSFVCVLHNDAPIPWGRNNVNVVMMFGLSKEDIHQLGRTLDIIINRFSSARSMRDVLASDTFDEFVSALLK